MIKIALLADLHFGSVPEGLAAALRDELEEARPDLAIIAGDLTLRARPAEFAAAQEWVKALTPPVLILPGNHDVPFFNLLQRFADPFGLFVQSTGAALMPVFEENQCFILGFNTTGSWQPHLLWQEGVARRRDMQAAAERLDAAGAAKFKAVAAHHPFFTVPKVPRARPVRRAGQALDIFARRGVELIMSGHTHQSFAQPVQHGGARLLALGAPTALSNRRRGEANGYWLIGVSDDAFDLSLRLRGETHFSEAMRLRHPRHARIQEK